MRNDPNYSKFGGQLEETEIVWLSDPHKHPYVREGYVNSAQILNFPKKHLIKNNSVEVIGYAILAKNAPYSSRGVYKRRYWFLLSHEDPCDPEELPKEAVNPRSIKAGQESKRIERPAP